MSFSLDKIQNALIKLRNEEYKKPKFNESIEIQIALRDIDLKDPSKRFNLSPILPHPVREKTKLAIFADGELETKARNLDLKVISKDEIESLGKESKIAKKIAADFEFFIALAPLMPLVGRFWGKYLGSRNKMPKPLPPSADLDKILTEYNKTINLRLKTSPSINAKIGTLKNSDQELRENINSTINAIISKLEKGSNQINKISIKTTMGHPIIIQ